MSSDPTAESAQQASTKRDDRFTKKRDDLYLILAKLGLRGRRFAAHREVFQVLLDCAYVPGPKHGHPQNAGVASRSILEDEKGRLTIRDIAGILGYGASTVKHVVFGQKHLPGLACLGLVEPCHLGLAVNFAPFMIEKYETWEARPVRSVEQAFQRCPHHEKHKKLKPKPKPKAGRPRPSTTLRLIQGGSPTTLEKEQRVAHDPRAKRKKSACHKKRRTSAKSREATKHKGTKHKGKIDLQRNRGRPKTATSEALSPGPKPEEKSKSTFDAKVEYEKWQEKQFRKCWAGCEVKRDKDCVVCQGKGKLKFEDVPAAEARQVKQLKEEKCLFGHTWRGWQRNGNGSLARECRRCDSREVRFEDTQEWRPEEARP